MARRLRSGYTTGACSAAAARAAAELLVTGTAPAKVEIPFPDSSRHAFEVLRCALLSAGKAEAVIIKDAGDDPDVTNGAEIIARVETGVGDSTGDIEILGGPGVGRVTKPGLAVPVGEPAINPVPRRMIREAVTEVLQPAAVNGISVTIEVPRGEEMAEKTLNQRLGILGGISILGTTGIVRPVSADAWTATISASMSVAREAGLREVVISTGRTSEKAVQSLLKLPEEALVMMGDYLEFSLLEAARFGFERIHLAGMWAKLVKAALKIPQTHVRNGALEIGGILDLLRGFGVEENCIENLVDCNTARELYERLDAAGRRDLIVRVCETARDYAAATSGLQVDAYLVQSSGRVVEHV